MQNIIVKINGSLKAKTTIFISSMMFLSYIFIFRAFPNEPVMSTSVKGASTSVVILKKKPTPTLIKANGTSQKVSITTAPFKMPIPTHTHIPSVTSIPSPKPTITPIPTISTAPTHSISIQPTIQPMSTQATVQGKNNDITHQPDKQDQPQASAVTGNSTSTATVLCVDGSFSSTMVHNLTYSTHLV